MYYVERELGLGAVNWRKQGRLHGRGKLVLSQFNDHVHLGPQVYPSNTELSPEI